MSGTEGNVLMRIAAHLADVGEGQLVNQASMLSTLGLGSSAARRVRDLKAFGWKLDTYKDATGIPQGHFRITTVGRMPGSDGERMSVSGYVRPADVGLEALTREELQRFHGYLRTGLEEDRAAFAYGRYQRLTPAGQQRVKALLLDLLDQHAPTTT